MPVRLSLRGPLIFTSLTSWEAPSPDKWPYLWDTMIPMFTYRISSDRTPCGGVYITKDGPAGVLMEGGSIRAGFYITKGFRAYSQKF